MTDALYDEITYAQNKSAEAHKERLASGISMGALALGAGLVVGLSVFEAGVAFTLMNEVYGSEIPTEALPFSVLLMSAATLIGVVGYEVLRASRPDSKALKFLEHAAYLAVPFFFVGMLATFGLSEIAGHAPSGDIVFDTDTLLEPSEETERDWEGVLGALSSLSLGALMIINLIVISKLVEMLRTKFPATLKRWRKSSRILITARAFITEAKSLAATRHAIARLDRKIGDDLNTSAAGNIEIAAAPALRTVRKLQLRTGNAETRQGNLLARRNEKLPHPLPDQQSLEDFSKALDAKFKRLPDQFRGAFD